MFEGCHLDRVRNRACRKQKTKYFERTCRRPRPIAASAALTSQPAPQKRLATIRAAPHRSSRYSSILKVIAVEVYRQPSHHRECKGRRENNPALSLKEA